MPATYEPIEAKTLGSDVATVTFSSIPATYTDLVLVMAVKKSTSDGGYLALRYNSDTATNYSATFLYGDGTSALSGRVSSEAFGRFGNASTSNFQSSIVSIQNYANATTFKTSISRSSVVGNYTLSYCTLWRKTPEVITSITILTDSGNLVTGSTFTLYGIKAA
jgi:hypothetical protein